MKLFKCLSVITVALVLLAPTTAFAKTRVSFSLNLIDFFPRAPRMIVVPQAPPVYYCVPTYPVSPPPQTIVNEYHYYHQMPVEAYRLEIMQRPLHGRGHLRHR